MPCCAPGARPTALCSPARCRPLRALLRARPRGPVPLRQVPHPGAAARLRRTKERQQQEALRQKARPATVCGLWDRHGRRHCALSPLRGSLQCPRARPSSRLAVAAADHRGRSGDRRRAGFLRRPKPRPRPASSSPACAPTRSSSAPTRPSWQSRRAIGTDEAHSPARPTRQHSAIAGTVNPLGLHASTHSSTNV